jgi:hypothetical protein
LDAFPEGLACGRAENPKKKIGSIRVTSTDDPSIDTITASEFRRSIRRVNNHYSTLKDDKYFDSWNKGHVANGPYAPYIPDT